MVHVSDRWYLLTQGTVRWWGEIQVETEEKLSSRWGLWYMGIDYIYLQVFRAGLCMWSVQGDASVSLECHGMSWKPWQVLIVQ